MKRSDFLKALAGLPFLGALVKCESDPTGPEEDDNFVWEGDPTACPTCKGFDYVIEASGEAKGVTFADGYLPAITGAEYMVVPCPECTDVTWYAASNDQADQDIARVCNEVFNRGRMKNV